MGSLKVAYGSTSATRLGALTFRFNQYVLDPKHSMIQHLDVMKDMIRELQNAGCELSDKQQDLVVLRSLPEQTWGHVELVLTHNEHINTFNSVASHLKLEADCRESERAQGCLCHTCRYRRNKICEKGLSWIHKLPPSACMQPLHRYGEWHTREGPWDWFIPTHAQHWV
ncbi:UNVERIFIED_CONTAM: hypothetical protein Scaly_2240900 [Sesamum calycinum]|uniref:Uncharacterized protein n=1 Tax=Sesamum calycinum TaxID=2727403 RepID=A0AAW2MAT3_9LAMI